MLIRKGCFVLGALNAMTLLMSMSLKVVSMAVFWRASSRREAMRLRMGDIFLRTSAAGPVGSRSAGGTQGVRHAGRRLLQVQQHIALGHPPCGTGTFDVLIYRCLFRRSAAGRPAIGGDSAPLVSAVTGNATVFRWLGRRPSAWSAGYFFQRLVPPAFFVPMPVPPFAGPVQATAVRVDAALPLPRWPRFHLPQSTPADVPAASAVTSNVTLSVSMTNRTSSF